uniref:Chromosome 1 open reading frame, human C10orf90 n=1 Tax=Monodelphis domestica TaxID=13616 RepID=K7E680_MONDO
MQQGEQCMALSATLVGPSPRNDFVPDVSGSPKDDYQSSKPLESQEIQPQQFLKSKAPLPDYLCPLKALCPSSQEDIGVPVESPFPPGDYRCCDLVVKLKKYERPVKEEEMIPESPPAPAEPMSSPEKPDTAQEQDVCPEAELNVFPVHSLTLREALEVYKPQFISRSQERLRKLESMAQQRKAQGCETPRKKPSPLPLRPTKKKQYTIPHPLSGKSASPLPHPRSALAGAAPQKTENAGGGGGGTRPGNFPRGGGQFFLWPCQASGTCACVAPRPHRSPKYPSSAFLHSVG